MLWSETPKHQNNLLRNLSAAFFGGGAICYLCALFTPFPALAQTVAIALFCAAIFLVARHQEQYTYRLEPDAWGGEGSDIVVTQKKNRQHITVCRLGVSDVRRIDVQTADNAAALKQAYANVRVHSYCIDVRPASSVYLTFDDGGNEVVIRLQCSNELIEIFRKELEKNKEKNEGVS